ncbi:MAG: single-stranded-DNA-specific exonuclease RecJ, partial [Lachnospiraceae bacterium]|nr:single-stranded-DNA-specific exonuclease RecJ [Lachnospiraceae bacterium]
GELKSLNDSRKDLTELYRDKAVDMIEESEALKKDRVLVVYLPDCHESLAGIIAGRIREKYSRPAFLLTKTDEGVKGSGRSIEAYDMHGELIKCADLLDKFGGHKMAAGLSLKEENVEALRKALNDNCTLTEDEMQDKLTADIALPLAYATMDLAEELNKLEPYGRGNDKPLFVQKDLSVSDLKVFGKNRNVIKMRLRPTDNSCPALDAIMFGDGDEIEEDLRGRKTLSVMYELEINEYNGRRSVQLRIKDYR